MFTYLLSIVQEVGNESYPEFGVEKLTQPQSNGSAHRVNRCYRRGVTAWVERIRTQAKESFANTISGTDLIVGGRSGQVNLLLYSVFRIGNATNNIDWKSYQEFSQHLR